MVEILSRFPRISSAQKYLDIYTPLITQLNADIVVIQTTSTLDGKSTWIEVFPITVSKSQTAAWLAEGLGIDKERIVSIGNDYNDLDLLEWTTRGYVVDNAPADLKSRFTGVASNNNGGVAEAARRSLEGTFANR